MERKWEDLGMDCLINVFERLEIQDLTLGVPFVCKNWYRASLDPHCLKTLDFSILNFGPRSPFASKFTRRYHMQNFSITGLMKFTLKRGGESVIKLLLPSTCELDTLIYASDMCPHLKILGLPSLLLQHASFNPFILSDEDMKQFFGLIPKWKDLEYVHIQETHSYTDMFLSEISFHCRNFTGLKKTGLTKDEEALAIVNHLPGLKHLTLTSASISRENFKMILEGCKELEELIVRDCCGFEVDEEILKMTSRIKDFEYGDLRIEEDDQYYYPGGYNSGDSPTGSESSDWEF